MWLSKNDTHQWARKWPCSTISNKRLAVSVDSNGLCDLAVNSKSGDVDGSELEAIVTDHLPEGLRHLWPIWT